MSETGIFGSDKDEKRVDIPSHPRYKDFVEESARVAERARDKPRSWSGQKSHFDDIVSDAAVSTLSWLAANIGIFICFYSVIVFTVPLLVFELLARFIPGISNVVLFGIPIITAGVTGYLIWKYVHPWMSQHLPEKDGANR